MSVTTGLLLGFVALIIGAVTGAMWMKLFSPQVKINRDLQQRLHQSEEKLTRYQQEVTEHFTETSRLVNNLTKSYRDVHEYLASSAMKLTNPSVSQAFLPTSSDLLQTGIMDEIATDAVTEQEIPVDDADGKVEDVSEREEDEVVS